MKWIYVWKDKRIKDWRDRKEGIKMKEWLKERKKDWKDDWKEDWKNERKED